MHFCCLYLPDMKFIKELFFGILSCLISLYLIYEFYELKETMESLVVYPEGNENQMEPTLVAGGIKIGLISVSLPIVFLIVHLILRGNRKVTRLGVLLLVSVIISAIYSFYSIFENAV